VSIPFSLSKAIAQGTPKTTLYQKAFVRLLILIALRFHRRKILFKV